MVAINVSRTGPGIGGIQPAQSDYYQMTRGGGNGDYHIPVFTPATMQEAIDCIYKSFAIANQYRNPVFISPRGFPGSERRGPQRRSARNTYSNPMSKKSSSRPRGRALSPAQAVSMLLVFLLLSGVGGILTAGFAMPFVGVTTAQ